MYVYLLPDKPINTMISVVPSNPRLNQLIEVSCTAAANPKAKIAYVYINKMLLGFAFPGVRNLTENVTDCLKYSGNFECSPNNALGRGVSAQQLVVVQGLL